MQLRTRLVGMGMALAVASVPTVALAGYSSSAVTYRTTVNVAGYGNTRVCLRASVTTDESGWFNDVTHGGQIYAYDSSGGNCDGARTLPAAWLGVTVDGYREGGFCGTTGYSYSPSANSTHGILAVLCWNPWGWQPFYTNTFGRIYNGSGYVNVPGISSPVQQG